VVRDVGSGLSPDIVVVCPGQGMHLVFYASLGKK
jgi:hypothetical protein